MVMQTVVELPIFIKQAAAIFTAAEKDSLIDYLAANPLAGDEIPGTGGVRKVRFVGKGKSGGARVIYYWFNDDAPLYALLACGKGKKTNLTADDTKAVAAIAKAIKAKYRNR